MVGSEGALLVDDTHKDVIRTRMSGGIDFPMSTMPGEKVYHVYAGPMEAETGLPPGTTFAAPRISSCP